MIWSYGMESQRLIYNPVLRADHFIQIVLVKLLHSTPLWYIVNPPICQIVAQLKADCIIYWPIWQRRHQLGFPVNPYEIPIYVWDVSSTVCWQQHCNCTGSIRKW